MSRYNGSGNFTDIANIADASTKTKFPAWQGIDSSDGFVYTSPVGQFRPNNFGLYDMLGNALEWCHDWNDENYYRTSPEDDPPGAPSGKYRSAHGCAFTTTVGGVAGRWRYTPDHHGPECGFRVVCEIPKARETVEPAPIAAPPTGDSRHAWLGDSRFETIAPGKWRETYVKESGHPVYFFDEVARTPEFVELIDTTRIKSKGGVSVRLMDNQSLMRWGGPDKDFNLLQRGQWLTTAKPSAPAVAQEHVDGSASPARVDRP